MPFCYHPPDLWKGGYYYNRADQTKAGNDPSLETETPPDYAPQSGTLYQSTCNHLVYDSFGTLKLDETTEDSTVY